MRFLILGPLEILNDAGRPAKIGGGKERAVLAALLLRANHVVSVDELIEALWEETPPAAAGHAVQVYVSHIRTALAEGATRLATRSPGYILTVHDEELDFSQFEALVASGRDQMDRHNPLEAARLLRESLGLWRGDALPELTYESYFRLDIERLAALRVAALEDRIDADLALGRYGELVPELEHLVELHPFQERLAKNLMLALYGAGRTADALDAYGVFRKRLADELGIDPPPDIVEAHRRILQRDATLLAPRNARVEPQVAPPRGTTAPSEQGEADGPLPPRPRRPGRNRFLLVGACVTVVLVAVAALVWWSVGQRSPDTVGSSGSADCRPDRSVGPLIAFVRVAADGDIYLMNADGTCQTDIDPSLANDMYPDMSPDDSLIAFTRGWDIWVMGVDGASQRDLTPNSPSRDSGPVWSPDGRWIAFISTRAGDRQVFVMDSNGAHVRQVTFDPGPHYKPTWSPGGDQIAYVSKGGIHAVSALRRAGPVALLRDARAESPSWALNGKIAFQEQRGGGSFDVWVLTFEAGTDLPAPVNATNTPGNDSEPDWSRDGALVFDSDRTGHYEIYALTPGQAPIQLTTDLATDKDPTW